MDAKPQRPFRALKVRDENIPPSMFPAKTIHQRNKSSPALSVLAQGNGIKVATRRAAFADVSNTVRPLEGIKDDSALPINTSVKDGKDFISKDIAQSSAALSRPAQRPLSVSGLKGLFNSLTSGSAAPVGKTTADKPLEPQSITVNTSKPLIKRSTTVFRESEDPHPVGKLPADVPPPAKLEPIVQAPLACDEIIKQNDEDKIERAFPQLQPEQPAQEDWHDAVPVTNDPRDVISPEADFQNIQDLEYLASGILPPLEPVQVYEAVPLNSNAVTLASQPPRRKSSVKVSEKECGNHLLPVPSVEEYWEHAVYDEPYDDESYTTARSFKFRGELSIGATTVVFAPKTTARDEREMAAAQMIVDQSLDAEDIEADEAWDTSMVAEYGDEIFEYMRRLEEQMRPNAHYMDNQTEVQWSMRSVLMDWLVQVHHRFSLLPETLFLCVNYIDRFLSCKVVSLGKLQLVGATAIFIAAKYEEINCPSIQEIVYMVDGGYTVDEILKAERFMLTMLQFELGWPGPMSFLRRISKADDYDLETRTLAKYFLELTIMDERFVSCIPSYAAAGAHCLARLMLKKGIWSPAHVVYSKYTYSQLRPLLQAMLSCCEDPQKHHSAIFDKYGDKRFKRASYFVQSEINKGFVLPTSNIPTPNLSNIGFDRGNECCFEH